MLLGEQPVRHVGADLFPNIRWNYVTRGHAVLGVVGAVPGGQLVVPGRVDLKHRELGAQPGRGLRDLRAVAGGDTRRGEDLGVGVDALTEQVFHLRLGDRARHTQLFQADAHPDPGGFTLGGVVVAQRGEPPFGGVARRNLPCQVGVAVAGSQLVQTHHRRHSSSSDRIVT